MIACEPAPDQDHSPTAAENATSQTGLQRINPSIDSPSYLSIVLLSNISATQHDPDGGELEIRILAPRSQEME